jgi:hypothetical protein
MPRPKLQSSRTKRHHLDRRIKQIIASGGGDENADELLTTVQMAEWFGVSTQWLVSDGSKATARRLNEFHHT